MSAVRIRRRSIPLFAPAGRLREGKLNRIPPRASVTTKITLRWRKHKRRKPRAAMNDFTAGNCEMDRELFIENGDVHPHSRREQPSCRFEPESTHRIQ